jgi:cytochrome c-type biogenesis protein CcmH/NrfG
MKGNGDYNKGNFTSAVMHYTKAIALAGKNTTLLLSIFTNRAISLLKLRVTY